MRRQKGFINVVAVRPDAAVVRVEGATLIPNLSEELLAPTPLIRVVVDIDVMVLGIERLLHKWFHELGAIDQQVVLELLHHCRHHCLRLDDLAAQFHHLLLGLVDGEGPQILRRIRLVTILLRHQLTELVVLLFAGFGRK